MNVRSHARIAESADQNGIEIALQHGEPTRRNGNAVGQITIGAPIKMREFDVCAGGSNDLDGFWNYFFTNPVARNDGNTFFRAHRRKVTQSCKVSQRPARKVLVKAMPSPENR